MGRLIVALLSDSEDFDVVAELTSGSDLAEMVGADIAVDVTTPSVSADVVQFAAEHGIRVLVGTSGWSAPRVAALRKSIDADAAVLIVPNFSLGSVLATSFAAMAGRFFESVEIIESHHAAKPDSPSGTAVRTAELIGAARSELGPVRAPHADQRARGQQVSSVPIHSLRLSGVVAKQEVVFGGTGEVLTLTHETLDNSAYHAGILLALRGMAGIRGVVVGLDALLDLGAPPAVRR